MSAWHVDCWTRDPHDTSHLLFSIGRCRVHSFPRRCRVQWKRAKRTFWRRNRGRNRTQTSVVEKRVFAGRANQRPLYVVAAKVDGDVIDGGHLLDVR
jgi:hypothetical protein